MATIFLLSAFLLGLIVGSFINVVTLRYNTGTSLKGRSKCLSCSVEIEDRDLIPVLSHLKLKGRCRNCGVKISIQYPLVEIAVGLLFAFIVWKVSIGASLSGGSVFTAPVVTDIFYWWAIAAFLMIIFVYDLRHKIIPDGIVFGFIALSFFYQFINPFYFSGGENLFKLPSATILAAGPLIFLPFFALWFFSGGRWMGFGDAKLGLGIGWSLGLAGAVNAVILAFWIGALFSIFVILLQRFSRLAHGFKGLTIKSEIPFAPFLIIGMALVYFLGIDILGLSLIF